MFDVFYSGVKPDLFAHEREARDIVHAGELSSTRYFWWTNYLTDYAGFDFLFEPVPWQAEQVHAWPSQWQKDSGTYLVPRQGSTDINYHTEYKLTRLPTADNWSGTGIDTSWHPDPAEPAMIYQFGTQWQKTGGPRYSTPGAVNTKYVDHPRITKTTQDPNWQIPPGTDTGSFDWTWHPDATDPPYLYQFGTQHQRTGGPCYAIPGAVDTKYVDQIRIRTQRVATAIYEIDHMDGNAGQISNEVKTVRYFDNYLDTLKRIARSIPEQHEFVWICSSVCDYTDFDFTWHPEVWQATMLHVFPSDSEKFGDTFFMHVPSFLYKTEYLKLLEWFDTIHFVADQSVPRRPTPQVHYTEDTVFTAIKNYEFREPVVQFYRYTPVDAVPVINLWRAETRTLVPLARDSSIVVVPRDAKTCINSQVYDYPYIDKRYRKLADSKLQDIVFISYDEPDADANWQILSARFPRAKRIHGVAGMEQALEVAANTAQTPWYYAVFAKTKLCESFNFDFVPDYFQQPKHYIFNSLNTVNGLEYGHMGIVMYNSAGIRSVNQTGEFGLDYTMSFPNESIPILSCLGSFDQSPYHTWRTAFREAGKLAYFESVKPTVDGAYRLDTWSTHATGAYADWCLTGARDGVEFVKDSNYELSKIKKAFRWEWLRDYFVARYGDLE